MATNRRSRRPRWNDSFWTDPLRSGIDDPTVVGIPTPSVAEAERLLEEARQAEAEQAAALARQAEDDERRRAELQRDTGAAVDGLEERLESEVAGARTAAIPPDRELRVLCRGFLHGFAPRSVKRMSPPDLIAARDASAAQLLELSREAELLYDRLTSTWSEVFLALDHPLVRRTDAIEVAAWQAFVERIKVLAGECPPTARGAERQPRVGESAGWVHHP